MFSIHAIAQHLSGKVLDKTTAKPIEYVNIGIPGKSIGTVCDANGNFNLRIDTSHLKDVLLFSCIGYKPVSYKISDLATSNLTIEMQEANYNLNEVVIKPKKIVEKILGIKTTKRSVEAGFKENKLGYEMGVMMKNKKLAYLKTVNINIATCTYDTLFYRLNIYKPASNNTFENILKEPIYIKIAKDQVKETISIDLKSKNIVIEGNFLVAIEHVKYLGTGGLMFCSALGHKTYFRMTSQGNWESISVAGVSISVVADVEK
ncbi:MAG: carboxypeptidase-like regulatory domain-containing protein [Bacteroidia bacterium]|nr:carboxypeptidase-like regulatory domain-containing protein [Bacteroidia bacterium]